MRLRLLLVASGAWWAGDEQGVALAALGATLTIPTPSAAQHRYQSTDFVALM